MVLIIMCVLSVVASSLLLTTVSRYYTTFQSASWQESIVASEAGVDIAMNELRKRVVYGPRTAFGANWTTTSPAGTAYNNYGHAFPTGTAPYTLATHAGEGNTATQARIYVDVPGSGTTPTSDFAVAPPDAISSFISLVDNPGLADPDGVDRSRWWYRIRALGIAGVSGPARPNLDKNDNRLRRFSFFTDWRTGFPVTSPQVSRMVEVIAKPLTNFRNALMADVQINLDNENVLIDSYDSSKGYYSNPGNVGTMGNIATNGQLINANNAVVDGDALTNNGTVTNGSKITGQESSSFYQELTPLTTAMLNPAWVYVPDGGTIVTDASYTASTDPTSPTLVRLDGINLPAGGSVISIDAPTGTAATTPSFIKIYVQGDIVTSDDSLINVAAGVNAIIYFTGDINLQGDGIFNNSMLASHLVLNGVQPPANADGTFPARTITVSTYQDFEGIVYAPNHDLNLALQAVTGANSLASTTTNVTKQISKLQSKLAKALAQGNTAKAAQIQAQLDALLGDATPSQADDHSRGYNGIYGGFVARTINVANQTHIHYDETLRTAGPVNHYEIVNWFEDNLSRDTAGGAEIFWW